MTEEISETIVRPSPLCRDYDEFCPLVKRKVSHYNCSGCGASVCLYCDRKVEPFCFIKCKFIYSFTMAEAGRHWASKVFCSKCLLPLQEKHGFKCLKKKRKRGLAVFLYKKIFLPAISKTFVNGIWTATIDHVLFINVTISSATRKEMFKLVVQRIFWEINSNLEYLYSQHESTFDDYRKLNRNIIY